MRSESVDALIAELSEEHGETFAAPFAEAVGGLPVTPAALGKGRQGHEFRLAVFTANEAFAEVVVARAAGEADVYIVPVVKPLVTSSWTKQPRDPLIIGQQIGPRGAPWVGTGGIYVRAAENPDVILQVTNEHVSGEAAQRGRPMNQGGREYGVVWKVGGLQFSVPQKYDVATVAVRKGMTINPTYDQGFDANIVRIRRMDDTDINRRFANTGQTRGTMFGRCIAVNVTGLRVGYDGGVGTFTDQAAFMGEDGKPFSVGGHSGSTIVCEDNTAVALLFSGGPDSQNRDVTFANSDLPGAIMAAGGVPQLIA